VAVGSRIGADVDVADNEGLDMAMISEAEANLTAQNQITIPAAVRKLLNLHGGQNRADHLELIGSAAESGAIAPAGNSSLGDSDLAEVFDIEIADVAPAPQPETTKKDRHAGKSGARRGKGEKSSLCCAEIVFTVL
jgi:bifunctional DNA-binding transcriptional regulator/antitoxin component of YhaV-PrlF toxin-antitoxin module